MKFTSLLLIFIMCLFFCFGSYAQAKKTTVKKTTAKAPQSFTLSRADFDKLFDYKAKETIKLADNKYLDKAVLELNTKNGDMQLLRIKLSYFANTLLMIQVNGEQSTQVFIMSNDKTLSYKGRLDKDKLTFTKCTRDEIVSE